MEFNEEAPTKVFQKYYFPDELWSDEATRRHLLARASSELQRLVAERGGVQTVGDMSVRTYSRDDLAPGAVSIMGNEPIAEGDVMVIAEWRLAPLSAEDSATKPH